MAGSKAGSKLMGLSLSRAGATYDYGKDKAGFNDAGAKRHGSTKYESYPGEMGANPAYAGGVGTGQNGGMHDPGGKWISGAIKHPGALHTQLGVPQGKKIPAKKMAAARAGKEGPLAEKRADVAKTLGKF